MMFVTERNRLIFGDADIGDVVSPIHAIGKGDQQPDANDAAEDADLCNGVGTSMKDLTHLQTRVSFLW
jgi:hypothetical protein